MKYGLFLLLSLLVGASSFGQALPETNSELAVLKYSWTRERVNWDQEENVIPRGIPSRVITQKSNEPAEYQKKQVADRKSARLESTETAQTAEDPRIRYTYNVTVRNDSAKKIVEIDWDYIFVDEKTGEEIGRRQFTSDDKIEAGKTKKLLIQVASPPTRKVDVNRSGKNEKNGMTESVVIVRILYQDKSEWKAVTPK
jgi:hypothetical protein